MDEQKIVSKAGVIILDGTCINSTKFEEVKRLLLHDELVLNEKDRQLADERLQFEAETAQRLRLQNKCFELEESLSEANALLEISDGNVAELSLAVNRRIEESRRLRRSLRQKQQTIRDLKLELERKDQYASYLAYKRGEARNELKNLDLMFRN